ncbi:hypothetical protein M8C21_005099, partial [Ambrosia artemisiifolia]
PFLSSILDHTNPIKTPPSNTQHPNVFLSVLISSSFTTTNPNNKERATGLLGYTCFPIRYTSRSTTIARSMCTVLLISSWAKKMVSYRQTYPTVFSDKYAFHLSKHEVDNARMHIYARASTKGMHTMQEHQQNENV